MFVYRNTEPGLWTVGFYDPEGEWHPESDHSSKEQAAPLPPQNQKSMMLCRYALSDESILNWLRQTGRGEICRDLPQCRPRDAFSGILQLGALCHLHFSIASGARAAGCCFVAIPNGDVFDFHRFRWLETREINSGLFEFHERSL